MVAAELHPKSEIPYPDVHIEISFIFDHTATYSALQRPIDGFLATGESSFAPQHRNNGLTSTRLQLLGP
jgi:hypothetical protein